MLISVLLWEGVLSSVKIARQKNKVIILIFSAGIWKFLSYPADGNKISHYIKPTKNSITKVITKVCRNFIYHI
jgi:hypothetical protein